MFQLKITGPSDAWDAFSTFSEFTYHLLHDKNIYDTSAMCKKTQNEIRSSHFLIFCDKQGTACMPVDVNKLQEYLNYNLILGSKYIIYATTSTGEQDTQTNKLEFQLSVKPFLPEKGENTSQSNIPLTLKIIWQEDDNKPFVLVSLQNNPSQDFTWYEKKAQDMFKFTLEENSPTNEQKEYHSSPLKNEGDKDSKKIIIGAGKEIQYKYAPEEIFEFIFKKNHQPRFELKAKYFITVSPEDKSTIPQSMQNLHSNKLPLIIYLQKL